MQIGGKVLLTNASDLKLLDLHKQGAVTTQFDLKDLTLKVSIFPQAEHVVLATSPGLDVNAVTAAFTQSIAAQIKATVRKALEQALSQVYVHHGDEAGEITGEIQVVKLGDLYNHQVDPNSVISNLQAPSLEEMKKKIEFHAEALFQTGSHVVNATFPAQPAVTSITKPFHDLIPGYAKMLSKCPAGPCPQPSTWLQDVIVHLNDDHRWSREQIADWLETLDHDLTFRIPE